MHPLVASRATSLALTFTVIAMMLDAANAETDIGTLKELKKVRDKVIHEPTDAPDLPTEKVVALARKYISLHLQAPA